MPQDVTIRIHAIADDGYPDMEALTGRVAFLFDGCIVSGWPLHASPTDHSTAPTGLWEADTDVGHNRPMSGVTHWVEFPQPVWDYERDETAGPSELQVVLLDGDNGTVHSVRYGTVDLPFTVSSGGGPIMDYHSEIVSIRLRPRSA